MTARRPDGPVVFIMVRALRPIAEQGTMAKRQRGHAVRHPHARAFGLGMAPRRRQAEAIRLRRTGR